MARWVKPDVAWHIDELMLLACPVQEKTRALVSDSFFDHVYSFHSHADLFQVLDPQGWPALRECLKKIFKAPPKKAMQELLTFFEETPLFSARHFPAHETVKHIKVVMHNRDLFHIEFLLMPFINALPQLLLFARKSDPCKPSQDCTIDFSAYNR